MRTLFSEITLKKEHNTEESLLPINNQILIILIDVEKNWRNWQPTQKGIDKE